MTSPGTPANWLPDPTMRHELRYWDGAQWTDHVADRGQRTTDSYDAAFVPSPPPSPELPAQRSEIVPTRQEPIVAANQDTPPGGMPIAVGQAVSSADVREAEQLLWEGETQNLTAIASGGKMVNARYRLTSKAIYVNRGIVSAKEERWPIGGVANIVVKQSIIQKRRDVGDLRVQLHNGGIQTLESLPHPYGLRDAILSWASYEQQRASRAGRTFYPGR